MTDLQALSESFDLALRQWAMYANEARQFDGGWIGAADDAEALMYQAAIDQLRSLNAEATLANWKKARGVT